MGRTGATALALLVTLGGPVGLSSCGDDGASDPPSPGPTSASDGAASGVDVAPPLDRSRPALKALGIDRCEAGDGEVVASGEVRNRERKPVDFVVSVDWLDEQEAVVTSRYAVIEDAAPGRPTPWRVTATLPTTAASCTTRAASGKLLD